VSGHEKAVEGQEGALDLSVGRQLLSLYSVGEQGKRPTHDAMDDASLDLVDPLQLLEPIPRPSHSQRGGPLHQAELGLDVVCLFVSRERVPCLSLQFCSAGRSPTEIRCRGSRRHG